MSSVEKSSLAAISVTQVGSTTDFGNCDTHDRSVYEFLKNFDDENPEEAVSAEAVTRKVDYRIMGIMLTCYFLQFLDKVALNYSNVMGMSQDIGLVNNQFSYLATFFFVAFFFFEPVQGFFLQKFSPSKVLGLNVLLWGVFSACCAAPTNFGGMLTVRILLGCAEAAISPCLLLITTMWYTSYEGSFRSGIWYCGLGLGQIFGGLISYLFQLVSNTSIRGWRIMFIVIGMLNIAAGLAAYFTLPDNPLSCKFLTPKEKYVLLTKLTESKVGIQNKRLVKSQFWELLCDIQPWLLCLLAITVSFSSSTISTFSSTDIISFGFTSREAALLNMPSGIVSIFSTLVSTYFVMKGFPRWIANTLLLIPAIIGGALMSFLPKSNQAGLLVGIYLINFIVAPLAIIYSWVGANFSGYTKKIGANLFIMFGFAIGNIVGPQSYQHKDAPDYYPAKICLLVTQALSIIITWVIAFIYYRRNKSRDEEQKDELPLTEDEELKLAWSNLTDFENRHFRYKY
ncbi:hypothetical protein G9P44_003468 [Scheffersomyces stipitis]|nr:hypothetical protein G9P44_003468 [Scheffersomyces stipitis]